MAEQEPVVPDEPVVEGDAVELPFAVADEPIAVATSRPGPDPVSRLGEHRARRSRPARRRRLPRAGRSR